MTVNFNAQTDSYSLSRASITSSDTLKYQKIALVALAAIGLGVALAACFVAPPLGIALSFVGVLISVQMFHIYARNNPQEIAETLQSIKNVAFKVLGIFSKKFADRVQSKVCQSSQPESTTRKIVRIGLQLVTLGLIIASFIVAPQLGFIFSAVVAGLTLYKWLDYAYTHNPRLPSNSTLN
jgi:hypothetical protein